MTVAAEGPLSAKVLEFVEALQATVARASEPGFGPDSWSELAEWVAIDDFERVGSRKEVTNWQEYTGFLTKVASASGSSTERRFSTETRRITETGNLVFLELREISEIGAQTTVVNSMLVYEFDDSGRIRHLDIYLQHDGSLG
jgi:hypothetical protein